MPYKDAKDKKANDALRAERARNLRRTDPEAAQRAREAVNKYVNHKYKTDPDFRKRRNRRRVVMKYGMKPKDYERILAEQNNACAICKTPHIDENGKRLSVDHNHLLGTGAVRGLLCNPCNMGLGMFKDSPTILLAAFIYLENQNEP